MSVFDPINAETYSSEYSHSVLATVDEVGKHVSSVIVTSNALQRSPYGWKSDEEA